MINDHTITIISFHYYHVIKSSRFRSRFDLDLSDLTNNIPLVPSQTNTNQSNTNVWGHLFSGVCETCCLIYASVCIGFQGNPCQCGNRSGAT